jgi:WD40 repeat protein
MTPALDPANARIEREFKCPRPLTACRFDPAGRFLFAAAEDSCVYRFDLLTGQQAAFTTHTSWVRGLAFVPLTKADPAAVSAIERRRPGLLAAAGGSIAAGDPPATPFLVASADYHGRLLYWRGDRPDAGPVRAVAAHDGWVRAVAASPDGQTVATCGNDRLVKLWSVPRGELLRVFDGHADHVYNVAFHPSGTRLVSADLKGVVKDWDLTTGKVVRDLDAKVLYKYDGGFRADIGGIRGLAFDPAGGKLACAGITNVSNAFAGVGNPLVVVFDWASGKAVQLKPKDAFQGTGWGVGFLPGGTVVAAGGGNGGQVWFWKGDDPAGVKTVAAPASVRDLAVSPAGDRLAAAGANGVVYAYTLRPGAKPAAPAKKK